MDKSIGVEGLHHYLVPGVDAFQRVLLFLLDADVYIDFGWGVALRIIEGQNF